MGAGGIGTGLTDTVGTGLGGVVTLAGVPGGAGWGDAAWGAGWSGLGLGDSVGVGVATGWGDCICAQLRQRTEAINPKESSAKKTSHQFDEDSGGSGLGGGSAIAAGSGTGCEGGGGAAYPTGALTGGLGMGETAITGAGRGCPLCAIPEGGEELLA